MINIKLYTPIRITESYRAKLRECEIIYRDRLPYPPTRKIFRPEGRLPSRSWPCQRSPSLRQRLLNHELIDGWFGYMGGWMCGQIDGRSDGGWMDGWMELDGIGWIELDGWMD